MQGRAWSSWGGLVIVASSLLAACGGDTKTIIVQNDSGTGNAPLDASYCISDFECSDGLFCNGAEICRPGESGADAFGCVASRRVPECDDGVACTTDSCSDTLNRCEFRAADDDGDGHADVACEDGEGEALGDDCDDNDANRFPGNTEVCDFFAHDEDCDGETVGARDRDGDGEVDAECCNGDTCGTDCNDLSIAQRSMQPEFCDGIDNNCDGIVDNDTRAVDWYQDNDQDNFGDMNATPVSSCDPVVGASVLPTDCNDAKIGQHPAQIEICDFEDNNCDGLIDEPAYCEQGGGVIIPDGGVSGAGGEGGSGGTSGTGGTGGTSGTGGTAGDAGTGGTSGTGGTGGTGGACATDMADCDLVAGCETSITTVSDCGACDHVCNNANALVSCDPVDLVCQIDSCATGYGDCDDNADNGCEASTSGNNASHCGRCDRSCGDGTCTTGRCNPVILMNPSGNANYCGNVLLPDRVAVITCWGNYSEVRTSVLTTPTPTELLGTQVVEYTSIDVSYVRGITADSTYLYWGVRGTPSTVYRKRLDGTGVVSEAFTTTNNEAFGGLTLRDGAFVWVSNSGAAGTDTIKRRVYPGGVSDTTLVNGINEFWVMAVTDTRVFWVDRLATNDYRLRMATLTQTMPMMPTEITMSTGDIRIAADDTHVYWTTELAAPNGALRRLEYGNPSAVIEPVAIGLANPSQVVVDDTYAYYPLSTVIYRVLKDGSAAPEAIANISSIAGLVGADDEFLYALTGASNNMNVVSVAK